MLDKPRVLVIQCYTESIKEYAMESFSHNVKYFVNKGYDTLLYTDKIKYHPTWLKIDCLTKINYNKYDYVWVLDADCLINNISKSIEELIGQHPTKILCSKNGLNGGSLLNSGSIIYPKESIEIILSHYAKYKDQDNKFLYEHWHEQTMLNEIVEKYPTIFETLDMDVLNSWWLVDIYSNENFIHHYMGITKDEKLNKIKQHVRK